MNFFEKIRETIMKFLEQMLRKNLMSSLSLLRRLKTHSRDGTT